MYGMSSNLHREKMPNHLLQWEAMRWAKAQGCAVYDLWGAPDELNESDSMWGVYKFKEGLGAEFAPHVGRARFCGVALGLLAVHASHAARVERDAAQVSYCGMKISSKR